MGGRGAGWRRSERVAIKKAAAPLTFAATVSSSVISMGGEATGCCLLLWPGAADLLGSGSLSLISMYRPLLLDPPARGGLSLYSTKSKSGFGKSWRERPVRPRPRASAGGACVEGLPAFSAEAAVGIASRPPLASAKAGSGRSGSLPLPVT